MGAGPWIVGGPRDSNNSRREIRSCAERFRIVIGISFPGTNLVLVASKITGEF